MKGTNLYKKQNVQEKVVSNELPLFISPGIDGVVIGNYMEEEQLWGSEKECSFSPCKDRHKHL